MSHTGSSGSGNRYAGKYGSGNPHDGGCLRVAATVLTVAAAIILPLLASAPTAQAFSPCSGYCNNVQNMYWSLNTNVQLGICDNCGPAGLWNWLLPAGQISTYRTPDVTAYYIGDGWCAKEFNSYGENKWTEDPVKKVGPVKVDLYDYPWNRVYAYPKQPNGVNCNY